MGFLRQYQADLLYHKEFPRLCTYSRFLQLMPRALLPLSFLLNIFSDYASIGKSTMGWLFGCKLHIVINHKGEIMAARLTPGNSDDRRPLPTLVQSLKGLLFADKGYLSSALFHELLERGLKLFTTLKRK